MNLVKNNSIIFLSLCYRNGQRQFFPDIWLQFGLVLSSPFSSQYVLNAVLCSLGFQPCFVGCHILRIPFILHILYSCTKNVSYDLSVFQISYTVVHATLLVWMRIGELLLVPVVCTPLGGQVEYRVADTPRDWTVGRESSWGAVVASHAKLT
jgi:hypothetical protein